jgi:hypothetical protein
MNEVYDIYKLTNIEFAAKDATLCRDKQRELRPDAKVTSDFPGKELAIAKYNWDLRTAMGVVEKKYYTKTLAVRDKENDNTKYFNLLHVEVKHMTNKTPEEIASGLKSIDDAYAIAQAQTRVQYAQLEQEKLRNSIAAAAAVQKRFIGQMSRQPKLVVLTFEGGGRMIVGKKSSCTK